ncbi:putative threonyl alanyl trna synthetase sad protein [Lasiodiplodia theobromae]|uniref:Threonyl alanyl trna synthetase sad protein n=1 Tax=Lasiodiplodia theobromae TaxID=45133 RepID=A0A8H7INQ9_9PEZI|nr:putative threonyl alanyl trna synthetase sad protein [Lasiodiplodia theobromae]
MATITSTDKLSPYFPSAGVANDGWSKEDEATATCFCGAVQLSFPTQGPGFIDSFVCNCSDCHKITASMFASNFTIADTHLTHLRGRENLTSYSQSRTVASGNTMTNYFCSTCEARLRVPRYLFRAFSASSRGSLEANNALSIVPDDPDWLYQASGDEKSTRLMIEKHLMWDTTHRSEFTSWTSSLLCALRHAMRKLYYWSEHESRVFIAVLDTSNFAIPVWAATALFDAYGIRRLERKLERHYYLGEYLVRGGISSANTDFRVASLQKLRMEGLHEFLPELFGSQHERERGDLACAIRDDRDGLCRPGAVPKTLKRSHIRLSTQLGECFAAQGRDSAFVSAVAVALLAMRKWAHLFEADHPAKVELEDKIWEYLQGLEFPETFGGEENFSGLANAHERYKPQEAVQFKELWQNLHARRPTENDLIVEVSRMSMRSAS